LGIGTIWAEEGILTAALGLLSEGPFGVNGSRIGSH